MYMNFLNPKFPKSSVQGRLKSCGAVVARRSYTHSRDCDVYDTHLSDADAVGSNPTRTIFGFCSFCFLILPHTAFFCFLKIV
jgi:hypothetical protein